jgi:HAD superfamily hydrolase (TIGR02253 family)
MQTIKVVLFDLDDTLIHFDDYWKASLMETIRRHPATKSFDPDVLFERLREMNQVYEKLYHRQEISLRDFRNLRLIRALAGLNVEIDEHVADDFNALHQHISRHYMKANPELLQMLTRLRQTYALGVVTNGTSGWQRQKIEALGIQPLFSEEAVIISEEVGSEKPAPEIFREALARFRVRPEEAVFVGDSWENDVKGPMRIGMKAIWYNKKNETPPDGTKPYGIIENIFELEQYV